MLKFMQTRAGHRLLCWCVLHSRLIIHYLCVVRARQPLVGVFLSLCWATLFYPTRGNTKRQMNAKHLYSKTKPIFPMILLHGIYSNLFANYGWGYRRLPWLTICILPCSSPGQSQFPLSEIWTPPSHQPVFHREWLRLVWDSGAHRGIWSVWPI